MRGTGVKLQQNSRNGLPDLAARRRKEMMEPSTSRKSTHSKPAQWKSTWYSAGCAR